MSKNVSIAILNDVRKIVGKFGNFLFAVDVMGSVARGKAEPHDLDVGIWVSSEVYARHSDELSLLIAELSDIVQRYGIELDYRIIHVEAVRGLLEKLCRDPVTTLLIDLQSIIDASAILHAVKTVDTRLGALLYATYLAIGWENVSWHNTYVHGIENVRKLVQNVGIENIRRAIHELASKILLKQ